MFRCFDRWRLCRRSRAGVMFFYFLFCSVPSTKKIEKEVLVLVLIWDQDHFWCPQCSLIGPFFLWGSWLVRFFFCEGFDWSVFYWNITGRSRPPSSRRAFSVPSKPPSEPQQSPVIAYTVFFCACHLSVGVSGSFFLYLLVVVVFFSRVWAWPCASFFRPFLFLFLFFAYFSPSLCFFFFFSFFLSPWHHHSLHYLLFTRCAA